MTPSEIGNVATEAALRAVWQQWRAIGAEISRISEHPSRTIIDPEGLLLMTLSVRRNERRLDDVLAWFAKSGITLISVKRFSGLAKLYPLRISEEVTAFAALALAQGDHRWKRLAQAGLPQTRPTQIEGRKNGKRDIVLNTPVALMLRLRAAFGVGVKPDVIAFLLGARGRPVTVREIAEATAYTSQAARTGVQDLCRAGILFHTTDRPVAYLMNPAPWDELFGTAGGGDDDDQPVRWHYIAHLFAMMSNVIDWARTETEEQSSAYIASSHARDISDGSIDILRLNGIDVPTASNFPGEEFLTAFGLTVQRVAEWLNR